MIVSNPTELQAMTAVAKYPADRDEASASTRIAFAFHNRAALIGLAMRTLPGR